MSPVSDTHTHQQTEDGGMLSLINLLSSSCFSNSSAAGDSYQETHKKGRKVEGAGNDSEIEEQAEWWVEWRGTEEDT